MTGVVVQVHGGVAVEDRSWGASGFPGGERRRRAMKPIARLTTIFLALVAFAHVLRLVLQVEVVAGGVRVPLWASAVACVVTGGLAILLWRERTRQEKGTHHWPRGVVADGGGGGSGVAAELAVDGPVHSSVRRSRNEKRGSDYLVVISEVAGRVWVRA